MGQVNKTERKKIRKSKIMNAAILERKICRKKALAKYRLKTDKKSWLTGYKRIVFR
jgi:hypothetical protein